MKNSVERWYDLYGRKLTRRDMLRISRDIGACVALGALPIGASPFRRGILSAGARSRPLQGIPFPLGVASGDPAPDGVVLWTRLSAAAVRAGGNAAPPVRYEVATDDSFRNVVQSGAAAAPAELGHSVHAEVTGLLPGVNYWYRFSFAGEASAVGQTRTAPAPGEMPDQLRFAFACCQNYEHGYFTAYKHMAEERYDLVVHLGDYIYERTYDPGGVREHEAGEVITLDDYRGRYSTYRTDPDLQAAHAACAWVLSNDDHEVENNYASGVSEANDPESEFLLRRAAAYQAYYEFMPLRRAALPQGPNMQLYRRLHFGSMLALHVLDTRQYRSDQACGDGTKARCDGVMEPARTMLGDAQERWLFDGLRDRSARWNVLANQIMLSQVERGSADNPTFPMDQWAGYVPARNRLLNFMAEARPSNPIVITGDIHSNWASNIKADFDRDDSPIIGAEFVATSISSGGDGSNATNAATLARNPHLQYYANRRGYVSCTLDAGRCTTDYRVVPFVRERGAPIGSGARFVVDSGVPGMRRD